MESGGAHPNVIRCYGTYIDGLHARLALDLATSGDLQMKRGNEAVED